MSELIYRFLAEDPNSDSCIESYFPATRDEIDWLLGKTVEFGAVWGQHSDVTLTLDTDHFTVISQNPSFVLDFKERIGLTGSCPINYLNSDYAREYHCLFPRHENYAVSYQ